MKNPVRNVVVEYKNKRSRKGNGSLWGDLDLKSISREVETAVSQSPTKDAIQPDVSEPPVNKANNTVRNDLSMIVADQKFENDQTTRVPVIAPAVRFEKEGSANNPPPKSELSESPSTKHKNPPGGKTRITTSRPHRKVATLSVTDIDLRTELRSLESENASLKKQLITKLRLENENLSAMLARMGQRTADKT